MLCLCTGMSGDLEHFLGPWRSRRLPRPPAHPLVSYRGPRSDPKASSGNRMLAAPYRGSAPLIYVIHSLGAGTSVLFCFFFPVKKFRRFLSDFLLLGELMERVADDVVRTWSSMTAAYFDFQLFLEEKK